MSVAPYISEEEFINSIWSQKCGDSLRIIRKTKEKRYGREYLWECEFIKYPCKVIASKGEIIRNKVLNPLIIKVEFFNKIWPQRCGDSLKIISGDGKGKYFAEFIKYPYQVLVKRNVIEQGQVLNPRIEEEEFIGREFLQNCGYKLKILEKTKELNSCQQYYYLIEFLNNGYKRKVTKQSILEGSVDNLGLPWKSKENLEKYIKENFKYKPTLKELQDNLRDNFIGAPLHLSQYICNYDLRYLMSYWEEVQQKEVLKYIKQICNKQISENSYSILNGKEIDIYIPELHLGIEYNGDYWHSDEMIRKKFHNRYKNAEDYHQEKYNIAKSKNINLYFVWEHDWKGRPEVVKRYLKFLINYYEKIYFNN